MLPAVQSDATDVQASHPSVLSSQGRQLQLKCISNLETDRAQNQEIGGNHYGPVTVYLSKVADASTADGSAGWFKIFQDGWAPKSGGGVGDNDYWGTKDLNTCSGKMNVKIPTDIPAGDYLLRAEALALHVASSIGGAQFYMTCYQITVTGGGAASPSLAMFPGAYKATDPGIYIDIHASVTSYVVPGPTAYAGGSTKSAGGTCVGVEALTAVPATTTHARRRHL